jgi:thiol-disulfide isomerase/thioredoxin
VTRRHPIFLVGMVAIAAAIAGYGVHLWRSANDGSSETLMTLRLADLEGRQQTIDQWRGKVLVVNFWATWCAPCREEIPVFVKLQDKYRDRGLQFVGVAIDERDKVQSFAREFGINYPVLLGTIDTVEISRQAGNTIGALPFTLVLDRGGRIVSRELGQAQERRLEARLQPLL